MNGDDGFGAAARSSSSSCSLNSHEAQKREATEAPPLDAVEEEEPLEALFGSESEEEPAASRVETAKSADLTDGVIPKRVRILPPQLDPPSVGFTETGVELPAEFELAAPLELKFAMENVEHRTEDVSLFAPGELLDVQTPLFDEMTSSGFIENGAYQQRVIRWRKTSDGAVECNTRLVEWDDGSFSFYVEGKWYDLSKEALVQGTELLCIDQQNCLQALHAVGDGLCPIALPSDDSDAESESCTATKPATVERQPKTQRKTFIHNPVKEHEEKLKKIEEERRYKERVEKLQKSRQESYARSSYDHLTEEDEETRVPQKRTRPSRHQPPRAKKRQAAEYEEDFIDEGEEEEMELGEDREEEEDMESESAESEEEEAVKDEETEQEEAESADSEEPQQPAVPEPPPEKVERNETAEQGSRKVVILSPDDDDEDVSD